MKPGRGSPSKLVRTPKRAPSPKAMEHSSRRSYPAAASVAVTANLIATIQRRLLETISSAEERRRSPAGVADMFVRLFRKLTKVGGIAVYLRDEQTGEMRGLAEAGGAQGPLAEQWTSVLERIERGARVATSDPVLVYPLKPIGRLDGLLVVQRSRPFPFQDRTIVNLLDAVTPWLAVALDHARLAQKYAQKIVRIQCLEEVSDVLNSTLDGDEKLRRALEISLRLVDAEAGVLFLLQADGRTLTACDAAGDKATRTGKSVLIVDAGRERGLNELTGWESLLPVRTLASVLVRIGTTSLGVLEVVNKRGGRPFSNWDLLELASLSNQLALALDHARLSRRP
jgi:hypothetical protein